MGGMTSQLCCPIKWQSFELIEKPSSVSQVMTKRRDIGMGPPDQL